MGDKSRIQVIADIRHTAKYMGIKVHTDGISWFDSKYKSLPNYRESWDALMPVIKKINDYASTEMTVDEYDGFRHVQWRMLHHPSQYSVEQVFDQAIDFIRHYKLV